MTFFLLKSGMGVISILLSKVLSSKRQISSPQDRHYANPVVGATRLVVPGSYPSLKSGCYSTSHTRKIFVSSRWLEHQTSLLIVQTENVNNNSVRDELVYWDRKKKKNPLGTFSSAGQGFSHCLSIAIKLQLESAGQQRQWVICRDEVGSYWNSIPSCVHMRGEYTAAE